MYAMLKAPDAPIRIKSTKIGIHPTFYAPNTITRTPPKTEQTKNELNEALIPFFAWTTPEQKTPKISAIAETAVFE